MGLVCKIDLKTAYDCLLITIKDRKYLQFKFNGKVYQYRGCPNGLSEAPRIFTRLTKPIIETAQKLGIRITIYIDDTLSMNQCQKTPEK